MSDANDKHPLVGQVLGERYRIEALLGEGGMGAVFRARHLSLDRPVAVKVLKPSFSGDDDVAKRFDREALAVSKLDHPNCVQVIDFGTSAKGMKYLVMQYLEGKELRDLTGFSLPVEQAVDFGVQIFRALEHAHKRGLVHRDLKPENIYIVQDDEGRQVVKLVDFGIVKLLEGAGQEKLTRMGMAFGTPTYMSPEQAAGGTIDERTDLYAVGVLLYEMLTGGPPFEADEPGILLRMHILAEPPPLPDTIPPAVAAVVSKLLAKEAGERYQDAREARIALAASLGGPVDETASASSSAPVLAGLVAPPDVTTDPPPAPSAAQLDAMAATASLAVADTRAEPVGDPGAHARSGGTFVAGASTGHGAAVAGAAAGLGAAAIAGAAAGLGGATTPGASFGHGGAAPSSASFGHGGAAPSSASFSHGAAVPPSASFNHGAPLPSASFSHGAAVPPSASFNHGTAAPGAVPYDPLAVSGAHFPRMPPTTGAYGHPSGAYGVVPTVGPRPRKKSSTALVIVVLLLLTWLAIGLVWWSSSKDDDVAPATAPTPAPGSGLYHFADDGAAPTAPASGSAPSPAAADDAAATSPSETPTAEPTAPPSSKKKAKKSKGKGRGRWED